MRLFDERGWPLIASTWALADGRIIMVTRTLVVAQPSRYALEYEGKEVVEFRFVVNHYGDDDAMLLADFLRKVEPASTHAPAQRQPWAPYLTDRADGVEGHFAVARWNPAGYREVWNLRTHAWGAFSDDVLTLEEAQGMLRSISFHPIAPSLRS